MRFANTTTHRTRARALGALLLTVALGAVALAAPAGAAGELDGDAPSEINQGCWQLAPLSPVGAAINGVAPKRRAACVGFMTPWLHTMPAGLNSAAGYTAAIHNSFNKTRHSFLHSSLRYHKEFDFSTALRDLHDTVGGGREVPDYQKPVIRFMFGRAEDSRGGAMSMSAIYDDVTSQLRLLSLDPDDWNVRVAVKLSEDWDYFMRPKSWNHTKLNIRDGYAVLTSSLEIWDHEVGMNLASPGVGNAATDAYDLVWQNNDGGKGSCVGSVCDLVLTYPVIASEPGYTNRSVNVFGLKRGWLGPPASVMDDEADRALFAGMRATQRSAFYMTPGLTDVKLGSWSRPLITAIAGQLANDVDVKLVWGNLNESTRPDSTWLNIQQHLYDALRSQLPPGNQLSTAMCSFHARDFAPGHSHAKVYMLDHGFYIGSQNLYPSSITAPFNPAPELNDFGYYVDALPGFNMDLSERVKDWVTIPAWRNGIPITVDGCHERLNRVRIQGSTPGPPPLECSGEFDAKLNFRDVDHDEVATLSGTGTCQSTQGAVHITLTGKVGTDRAFSGTIRGSAGVHVDTVPLIGTFRRGALRLSFSGLEPISGFAYSGTVVSK